MGIDGGTGHFAGATGVVLTMIAVLVIAQPIGAAALAHPVAGASSGAASMAALSLRSKTSCTAGFRPEFVAYDPITKWFYVTDFGASNVSVFKSACTPAGTIHLPYGSQPRGIAYSESTNRIYVADAVLDQVYVISKLTIKQTVTSPTFDSPFALAYDPAMAGFSHGGGTIVVTNQINGSVSFIAQTSPTGPAVVTGTEGVGTDPVGIAYSPHYDALLITNEISDNVTALDASTGGMLNPSIPVGSAPIGIAYDPATTDTLVANLLSDNVTVINPVGSAGISIGVGTSPFGVAYDPASGNLWVTNSGSRNISIIGSAYTVIGTDKTGKGTSPAGLAYDGSNNQMDVAIFNTATVEVL